MERLYAASLSSPYLRRTNIQCTALDNSKFNFNRTSNNDKSCNFNHAKIQLPLAQKVSPVISGQHFPSLSRGEMIVCQSTVRPAWLDTTIPAPLRPYFMLARVNRYIGWLLQVWPSYWYCFVLLLLYF
jgi:hypothetical protein